MKNDDGNSNHKQNFCSVILLILFISLNAQAQQGSDEPPFLAPNEALEREIAGGERHFYKINLKRGDLLRVAVEQKGVDVMVGLLNAKREVLQAADKYKNVQETEILYYLADADGQYFVGIVTRDNSAVKGKYVVRYGNSLTGTEEKKVIAWALYAAGDETAKEKNYERAIFFYEKSLSLWRELSLLLEEGHTHSALAETFSSLKQYDKALEHSKQALNIFQKLNKKDSETYAQVNIARRYWSLEQPEKMLEHLQQAFKLLNEIKNPNLESIAAIVEGGAYALKNQYARALQSFQKALSISRDAKNKTLEIWALQAISSSMTELGQYEKSLQMLEESLKIVSELEDKQEKQDWQLDAFKRFSSCYMELGQYDKGLYYGEQVLEMARKNKDEDSEHDILTTMGVVYLRLGSLQKAKEYLTLSAELSEKLKDPRSIALGIANLGAVYSRLKEYDKSVELFEKSLPVMRQLKWSRAIVIFGYYYGMVLREQGKIDKAIELHKESVELAHTAQTPKYEARALCELGLDYLAQGNFELARTQFSKALYIARQVKSRDEEAAALDGLMRVWNGNGQYKLGIFFGKQAVNLLQTTRNEIIKIDKQIQANFVKDNEQTYRKLVEILIADGRIAEAEQVLAMLKKEEVFTYLRRDDGAAKDLLQTVALTSREQETLLQYEAFADKITAIGKEFSELEAKRLASENGLTASDKVRYDELQAQLEIARAEFEKFLDKLKVEFGKNDLRVESVNSDLKSTLERIEAKRTAIVSVIVGGSRLNIIVTTANTQRAHTINVTEREVNELVAEFRQALINPKLDPRPAGQKLYNILVKPIEADLSGIQADTILWSLDGTLRYIPTAAIWDKQKGYLAERFANAFLTLANREALVQPVSDKKGWKALGVGVSKPTDGFTALAAVPDELDCIITDANTKTVSLKPVCQNGVIAGRKLLDENFTLTAFKDSMGRFPIVHIASHFSLNPGNEKDSFLLLGGGEQKRFTVDNLRGFSLTKVELIVLSACNTATPGGEKANGVEIEGFGAVAQRQGAKAVMATLWSVADDSTRDLMVKFYELYNKNNITKAEALKQAQTTMIYGRYKPAEGNTKRGAQLASSAGGAGKTLTSFEPDAKAPYSHPFYWSPFVLYGNWR